MAKPKVIAVANQKGGVGKSTSVYNIGAGLAMNGKNVLLIDVGPQGDLTKMPGQRKPHDLPVTLGNALNDVVADTENSSHPEILRHHEGFDFVPANRTLSAVEVSLVNTMSRETVLRCYVNSVKKPYDYVLLDCNPSLGMLVINALSASDYVLIPVQADYLAAEDMTELVGTVQNVKKGINHNLKIGGVFLTMANETNFRKEVVSAVKENFGKHLPVLQAVIPATVRLAEISTADKSIFRHEPRGKAAEAYASLKEHTRMEIYMTELFSFNLEYVIGQYQDYLDTCQSSFFDRNEIAELYRNIVRLLGSESDMERLNALFAQRFLLVKPIPLFIQAYTQDLLGSLLYRDPQSDHSVLQLLLDR